MKKIWPIILFFILLYLMVYVPYIPINLFNINIDNFSKGMKVLYNFFCDISLIIIFYLIFRKEINDNFKKYFSNFKNNFKESFKYYIIGFAIMVISNLIISTFFQGAVANNEEAVRGLIKVYPYYMFFSVSIYAPFIEEIIFRKSIYDSVLAFGDNKFIKYLYAIISGFVFSSVHVFGTINSSLDYLYIVPYFALGFAFALNYYKSKNIFSTVIMHSFHNTVTILIYLTLGVIK